MSPIFGVKMQKIFELPPPSHCTCFLLFLCEISLKKPHQIRLKPTCRRENRRETLRLQTSKLLQRLSTREICQLWIDVEIEKRIENMLLFQSVTQFYIVAFPDWGMWREALQNFQAKTHQPKGKIHSNMYSFKRTKLYSASEGTWPASWCDFHIFRPW